MAAYLPCDAQGPVLTSESRYEQLCEALVRARAERVARRDECFAFIERLVQGLIQHLKIPSDLVRLAPPSGALGDGPLTVGAASILGEDGYWQTGLHLTIGGQAFGSPSLVVALVIHVKKKDGRFLFKLAPDGPILKVFGEADASEAHDFVFQQLLESLRIPG